MTRTRPSLKTYAILFLTMTFWAAGFVSIRIGLHGGYTPGPMGLFRYLTASVCMAFIYFRLPNRQRVRWRDLPLILISGAVGIGLYNVAINYGELTTTAATASFIVAQTPIFVILFAFLFLGERLTWRDTMGLIISFMGIVIIAMAQHSGMKYNAGIWFVLVATIAGSYYTISQKQLLGRYSALEAATFAIWGGAASMLYYFPTMIKEVHVATTWATANVIFLGIFPAAIAYSCWSYVLGHMRASDAVLSQYFLPFLTTIIGFIVLQELPGFWTSVGGIIAIAGAFFATWRKSPGR